MLAFNLLAGAASLPTSSFTLYSAPIRLRFGEVMNRVQKGIPLPPDVLHAYENRTMAVSGYEMDLVRRMLRMIATAAIRVLGLTVEDFTS